MKKAISIFVLTALLLLLIVVPVSAADLFLMDVTAGRAEKAPVIDGVFDPEEGWGDPVVHHDSSDMKAFAETDPGFENLLDDASMMISNLDVYMKWDDTYFYYCANVTDTEHFNPEMDAAIWKGDSIIFHVVSVPNDDSRARILFGMDNEGETWAFQETMEDGTLDVSNVNDWKITRNDETKVTTYEALFKWEDIIPSEKLGTGESFYLRDLFLLANKAYPEPVVAVVPEGYTNGTRNYYKVTLADGSFASSGSLTEIQAFDYKECGDNTNEELQYSHEDPNIKTALSLKPLDGADPVGTWYDFDIDVAAAGDVEFTFLYAAKDDRFMDVTVNNETKQVTCPNTGDFQTFDKVSVTFSGVPAGAQTLRIAAPHDYADDHKTPNIDVIWYGASGAAPAAPAAQTTSETELLNKSWDTIFVDYDMRVDGRAGDWLAENPVEGDIEQLEVRGWAYIATPINGFAYTVDGGDAVKSADFIQDRPDVKGAINEIAEGFDIEIDVSGLGAGDHVIKIYAMDENDGLVDTTFEFPFTLTRAAAPAAAEGYPASGESGNAMIGTIIGNETGWDGTAASGAASAFDGKPATFFDPLGVGDGYCGMQFDEPYILEKVAILSRSGWLDRFAGACIEGSNNGEDWETIWESDEAAASETEYTVVTEGDFENNYGYTMFRYYNYLNHGDVAEVEFYGKPGKVDPPAKEEEPAPEPEPAAAPEPEPEPAAEPAADTPTAETPASTETPAEKKSGCGSFIGGGLIVLVTVLGSAWAAKRR